MSHWNYRMTKRTVNGEDAYEVREIFYSDGGRVGWTENPAAAFGETKQELIENLRMMSACVSEPVLDIDSGEWLRDPA